MTKREFDEFKESDCPCGKGQITKNVESTDYHFTSVHISYSLDCPDCRKIWKLEHRSLVLRESEKPYLAAKIVSDRIGHELYELSQGLVKAYCERLTFKTKKAELQHLCELDLCNETYAYYTKARREGKHMFEMAYGLRNEVWLMNVATNFHQQNQLSSLISAAKDASEKTKLAAQHVIRKSLKQRA
jgi:hypothetical protein